MSNLADTDDLFFSRAGLDRGRVESLVDSGFWAKIVRLEASHATAIRDIRVKPGRPCPY